MIRRLLAVVVALTLVAGLATVTAARLRAHHTTPAANCALLLYVSPHYLCWGPNGLQWI